MTANCSVHRLTIIARRPDNQIEQKTEIEITTTKTEREREDKNEKYRRRKNNIIHNNNETIARVEYFFFLSL